ncbi:hypothetical protein A3C89_00510 [Candidatus Kaiserbacteria bacterium RIFCSPHIGHO2_02_FULL_50_50]|uniref:Uncharacterized protein n=1 Tax=Candidatus Kaiserbacteria bacterium RIFCSPHIGHO2_02_FULL_50_50 TaxID=1798492 RepID=A0A1F6DFN3_9BACT|nr:MAG: hypothetical protein A3C89_00510 [Candidatus Kaiserbacteria bacterium RIFCSPHIGHO2_02_FULL_50_50]OGG88839.1 MAG: hypothetical protein A3G62_02950 [Candidatus Kaiserbacteria bacterium RIFCSPLOWO2_12_FULL_50_10]
MNKFFATILGIIALAVTFWLGACSGNKPPQMAQQEEVLQQAEQRIPAAPMTLVMHCVTVYPKISVRDPGFKAWVQKTMAAGKWCDEERVTLTIVTAKGRTAKKDIHLIGGESIETIPAEVVAEYPLTITVKPSGGGAETMRIGAPVSGRAILMVSQKKKG